MTSGNPPRNDAVVARIDQVDVSLFASLQTGITRPIDRRSLLATHAAMARRGLFRCLEISPYPGAALASFLVDPRCQQVTVARPADLDPSISDSRRDTEALLGALRARFGHSPDVDLDKVTHLETSRDSRDGKLPILCLVDGTLGPDLTLLAAKLCMQVAPGPGAILFFDQPASGSAVRRFVRGIHDYCAYRLPVDLVVVEREMPTLLSDDSLRAIAPTQIWQHLNRAGVVPEALRLEAPLRRLVGRFRSADRPGRTRIVRGKVLQHTFPRGNFYFLAVCAIFRDEAPYLREWITFHLLQGVEHFFLYDNGSTDDWQRAIAAEVASGQVTVHTWSYESRAQFEAYDDCLQRHGAEARWIAFIDVDEFLFSPTGVNVPTILDRFASHPGVAVNWRTFGTGGHRRLPAGPVIQNYLYRASDLRWVNQHVKAIVQPHLTAGTGWNVHSFNHYGVAVGEDLKPQHGPWRFPPTADLLRINHYLSKSLSEWETKLARPRADDGDRKQYSLPPDEVLDETALRFLPALLARIGLDGFQDRPSLRR